MHKTKKEGIGSRIRIDGGMWRKVWAQEGLAESCFFGGWSLHELLKRRSAGDHLAWGGRGPSQFFFEVGQERRNRKAECRLLINGGRWDKVVAREVLCVP